MNGKATGMQEYFWDCGVKCEANGTDILLCTSSVHHTPYTKKKKKNGQEKKAIKFFCFSNEFS